MEKTGEDYNMVVDISNCEKEPIHIPGKIQAHGCLLAIDTKDFNIIAASSNVSSFLKVSPQAILGSPLTELIEDTQVKVIKKWLHSKDLKPINPLNIKILQAKEADLYAILHLAGAILIIELEPSGNALPVSYEDLYLFVNELVSGFQQRTKLYDFLHYTAKQVKDLTGYDRIMIYRFDKENNGEVIAEVREPHLEPFLGLHYPASDIPLQARKLYLKNLTRIITDINYEASEIIALADHPLNAQPLDLSLSVLRSVSPMHIEYLQNMGVSATLTISIIHEGKLWGLIACHHYSPRYINYLVRAAAEFVGKIFSYHLGLKEETSDYSYETSLEKIKATLLSQITEQWNIIHGLTAYLTNFLQLNQCSGGAVFFDGQLMLLGDGPAKEQVQQLIHWLDEQVKEYVFFTDSLSAHYPAADAFKHQCSGLLAIRLSQQLSEYILWFKPEVLQTVTWGGNPNKAVIWDEGKGRLGPRRSFNTWVEQVTGKSLPWIPKEIEVAVKLREQLIDLILKIASDVRINNQELEKSKHMLEIRLQEHNQELKELNRRLREEIEERKKAEQGMRDAMELAEEMNRLKTNFLANMSHEIRTPINGIIGLATLIDSEIYDNEQVKYYLDLQKQSSERLLNTINSILDIARLESKNALHKISQVNISQMLENMLPLLRVLSDKKGLRLNYTPTKLQYIVHIDENVLQQIINNLVGNAIKFTQQGSVTVVVTNSPHLSGKDKVILQVIDTGIGISEEFIPKIFEPFEQESQGLARKYEGSGLGLSIVKRYVELFGGSIHLESQKGKGSTFEVKFPLVKIINQQ